MSFNNRLLKTFRGIHLYLGVFTAPMLLFFAITGGLQTFGLHESARGSSYSPPAWLVSMAQLHKKQTTVVRSRRPRLTKDVAAEARDTMPIPATAGDAVRSEVAGFAGTPQDGSQVRPGKSVWPMKVFFALVALGLLVSVLTGLYMAWRFSRRPRVFALVLLAGLAVPLLLLWL